MNSSSQKGEGKKNITEVKTFPVPFPLRENQENISFTTNIHSNSSKEQFINQAIQFHSQGNISEAAKCYQYCINQNFNDHRVFSNYGSLLKNLGRLKEAEINTRKAIKIKPDLTEAHYNLGIILRDIGKLQEAELSYRKAIEIKPDYAEAYSNLGNILNELGKLQEAELSYRKAIELDPDLTKTKMNLDTLKKKSVSDWHIPMMNDHQRNNAYLQAIKRAIQNNEFVLEIGTGSGILSMMAVDAGAEKVISCERSQSIAKAAKEILLNNGFSNLVSVINKKSTELTIGRELEKKVDLIISEILSSEFVGEGVQSTISDANKRLLKENGKMIPESGDMKIALLESNQELKEEFFVERVNGYDLSKFNEYTGNRFLLKNKQPNTSFLSNEKIAFSYNFYQKENIKKQERILELNVTKNGICLGLITWFKLNLYEDIYLETKPSGSENSHWANPVYTFKQPLNVSKGQTIRVKATLLEDSIWYEFIDIK